MDAEVQGCVPPYTNPTNLIAIQAQNHCEKVVVPVEEDELLFPENNEQSVTWGWGERCIISEVKAQQLHKFSRETVQASFNAEAIMWFDPTKT